MKKRMLSIVMVMAFLLSMSIGVFAMDNDQPLSPRLTTIESTVNR